MLRINVILLMLLVAFALLAVTSQHRARKLFQELEAEQERVRQLDVEFGQLQLEMSTWATHPRIEEIARERLRMRLPDSGPHPVDGTRRAPAATAGRGH